LTEWILSGSDKASKVVAGVPAEPEVAEKAADTPVTSPGFRDDKGRFLAGNSGNGGRRPGSRNRLNEKLLAGLEYAFDKRGDAGILEWANNDPSGFY
jgi:hypothetical protein